MSKIVLFLGLVGCVLFHSAPAFPNDDVTEPSGEEHCVEFGEAIKQYNKFAELKPEKRDTVGVIPRAEFKLKEGQGEIPERLFYRDGDVETELHVNSEGQVTNILQLFKASEDVYLCSIDPDNAGPKSDKSSGSFSLDLDIQYRLNNGNYDLAALKDGLKDGKSHYKKMAGAMSFMVPKFTHVMINYDEDDVPREFTAMKNGVAIAGLPSESFCEEPMIKVEDLEDMNADGLRVGGVHTLMPVPGPKTLSKFATCKEDETEPSQE